MVPPGIIAKSDPPRVPRGHEMVTIFVGATKEKFVVYENLLRAASQFFRAALSKEWDEGQSKTIDLPEEEPAVVDLFVDWLTFGHFDSKTWSTFRPNNDWHPDLLWLNVYYFADRRIIPGLQLQAFDQIKYTFNSRVPTIPSVAFIKALAPSDGSYAIRSYVICHVVYWLPKSKKVTDWARLFEAYTGFGLALGQHVIYTARMEVDYIHPGERGDFAMKNGLNVAELAKEARSQDEKQSEQTSIALGTAEVEDKNKTASFGLKRSTDASGYNTADSPLPRGVGGVRGRGQGR